LVGINLKKNSAEKKFAYRLSALEALNFQEKSFWHVPNFNLKKKLLIEISKKNL
jgi:hypothetical protein